MAFHACLCFGMQITGPYSGGTRRPRMPQDSCGFVESKGFLHFKPRLPRLLQRFQPGPKWDCASKVPLVLVALLFFFFVIKCLHRVIDIAFFVILIPLWEGDAPCLFRAKSGQLVSVSTSELQEARSRWRNGFRPRAQARSVWSRRKAKQLENLNRGQ